MKCMIITCSRCDKKYGECLNKKKIITVKDTLPLIPLKISPPPLYGEEHQNFSTSRRGFQASQNDVQGVERKSK